MTRFAIDAEVAVRLAEADRALPASDSLVGPQLLRSDAVAILYHDVRAGERSEKAGRALYQRLVALPVRLLGDRVSRWTAWGIARDLDWDDPRRAEYLAVAKLQADAFVTLDPELERAAHGIVPLAPLTALLP